MQNVSNQPARLRGLHRGNVGFETRTMGWLEDNYWTQVLREMAGRFIGLKIMYGDIFLCRAGGDPLRIELLPDRDDFTEPWAPPRPLDGAYAFYTGWESPVIEPGRCSLFRMVGSIYGKTYDLLMNENPTDVIQIVGGEPLEKMIMSDLEKHGASSEEYGRTYDEFAKQYSDKPYFYHVFFEFEDRRPAKLLEMSIDMKEVKLNEDLGGRCVSWCCSDMDFNIFAQANGPVLVLAAEQSSWMKAH